MELNVFKQYYSPWNHITNWPRNIRLFFRRYKWAYQRATRGYADCDVWDLDHFYTRLFAGSLNRLADIAAGYPGNDQFPTYEDWINYLREMAQLFSQSLESNNYYPAPAEEKWWDWNQKHGWKDENPFADDMIKEAHENALNREADFNKAWEMMGKVYEHLWD